LAARRTNDETALDIMNTYEDRITVFIDILGFKDLLSETYNHKDNSDNPEGIKKLLNAYSSIRDVWDLDTKPSEKKLTKKIEKNSKVITTFSDTVVISFLVKERSEIFYTLLEIKWMIIRLIYKGILVRGAVSFGKLIHNETTLFGPALVEAYILESKAANYPRIILDRDIIELAGKFPSDIHSPEDEIEYVESLLEKDSDGMYYIDYFSKAQEELDDPDYDFPIYIQTLGDIIRKGMNASKHPNKADIRVKYIWMKEKYNQMVENGTRKEFLSSLQEEHLYEFYKSLKKINPAPNNVYKALGRRRKN